MKSLFTRLFGNNINILRGGKASVHFRPFIRLQVEYFVCRLKKYYFLAFNCGLSLNNLQLKRCAAISDIEHVISSARSNELIEWQTGELFAYLTLRNSCINLTFRNSHYSGPSGTGR